MFSRTLFKIAGVITGIIATTTVVSAASLTEGQINSILDLLSSFGAEQGTITDVEGALRGDKESTETLAQTPASCDFIFTKNLGSGDAGDEVRKLQMFLNLDPTTQLAQTGPGAPGNETDYFGSITAQAVTKFQEKYKSDVLAPIGLTHGTGFWGASSRAKAHEICGTEEKAARIAQAPSGETENSAKELGEQIVEVSENATFSESIGSLAPEVAKNSPQNEIRLMFPSTYQGLPGDTVTITGSGFTGNDTVHVGSEHTVSGSLNGSSRLSFTVPDVTPQKYDMWVTNEHGTSNKDQFFIVRDPNVPKPKIETINPPGAPAATTTVTLTGSGFTETGNTIYAGFDTIEGASASNGNTLTFQITPDIEIQKSKRPDNPTPFTFWIYVVNDNGMSDKVEFTLEL